MVVTQDSPSARIRAKLNHPIVDADGHFNEVTDVLIDYIREVGGSEMADRYEQVSPSRRVGVAATRSLEQRRDRWTPLLGWWGAPTDAVDRATALVPKLLNDRLDEFGIDYMIMYPGQGLFVAAIPDDEMRQMTCRAFNNYVADLYSGYEDRMTPVASIPMHSPDEAVIELDHVVNTLGLKAVVVHGKIERMIPRLERDFPQAARFAMRSELFGLDSDYDYDKVWAKCVELGVAVTFHIGPGGIGNESVSNYVYNHVGGLAYGQHKLCKAMFMGGVTKRFPRLNMAFLESGVGWACSLYGDLLSHWEKRNGKAILDLDPAKLDRVKANELVREYADERTIPYVGDLRELAGSESRPEQLDEFAAAGIERGEQFIERFAEPFYFGCEADDPMTAQAFATKINPFGAKLKPILGSDIGHWDVPVMNEVISEAYELVEREAMTEENFKDFAFGNAITLHGRMNPDFYKGTRVEAEANKMLAKDSA